MNKRGPRPLVFVCVSLNSEKTEFISKTIQAASQEEAASVFLKETNLKAQAIHGPFRPKRAKVLENTRNIKFSNETKKAEYNGWIVNAFILKEPENHVYLVFIKRIDDQKQSVPVGVVTLRSEIKEI